MPKAVDKTNGKRVQWYEDTSEAVPGDVQGRVMMSIRGTRKGAA